MDVRCDRCQTEYELDDESVAGAGASVQCTTCGHTFVVSRNGSIVVGTTPPSGVATEPTTMGSRGSQSSMGAQVSGAPAVPEWVLATEEGQTHRLRDLTTLQKWVVERRVSRADRVSHRGGAWRTLGEIEELRPFFDVVDQADRQTGATRAAEAAPSRAEPARSVRPTLPATPRKVQNPVRHVSPDPEDDDVLSNAARGRRGADSFLDTDISPDDDDLSLALRPKRTGLKVVGAVAFLGLAGGVAWFMFREPHAFHLASGTPIAPPPAAPAPP
ncbi:MAG TPA: zinc-ribbon domain-containing protein, partial [Polyangia bacterium]|nr:zinc-ribbon domain-containing protein [Polyangia bacterium]